MHKSIGDLECVEAFDIWLYRLTSNAAYDHLRRRFRFAEVRMSDLIEGAAEAVTNLASSQRDYEESRRQRTIAYVDGLLSRLSPSDRILLLMREVEGLSVEEVSGVLGISVGAAKLRLFRARQRVRESMSKANVRAGTDCNPGVLLEMKA
jgi:RNA polymerase sigma-70 factor (ECF subfamily)